jgi:hypothetical protein
MSALGTEALPADSFDGRHAGLLDKAPRAALIAFVAAEAVGLALFVWFGRTQWFWWDEWELIAGRSMSVDDFLQPYHGHWIGGPLVVYRLLWSVFGLHTYAPYQLVGISVHLGIAALLRIIMRRSGVAAWIATIAAGAFVVFGTGKQNILWGFQIAFTGAVLLGLVHLLLADHDGRADWRDGLGLLAGAIALTCSGVGTAMIIAVGCSTLLRRGAARAALHVLPLATLFVAWWSRYGRHDADTGIPVDTWTVVRFVVGVVEATLHSLGQVAGTSWILLVILLVGLVLAWHRFDSVDVRSRAGEPLGLLVAGVSFLAFAAWGRAGATLLLVGDLEYQARYRYVFAALVLPAFAVAADAIARRWRAGQLVVVVPLLVGLPLNVREIADRDALEKQQFGEPALFQAVQGSALLDAVPGVVRPFPEGPVGEDVVTVDWIREERDSGRLPPVSVAATPLLEASARLRLSIEQNWQTPNPYRCVELTGGVGQRLEAGSSVFFPPTFAPATVQVNQPVSGSAYPVIVRYHLKNGRTLTAVHGPLDVTLVPHRGAMLCR